jgi:flagellar protein FlgJ
VNPIQSASSTALLNTAAQQITPGATAAAGQGKFAELLRSASTPEADGSQAIKPADDGDLKETFTAFVGQTLFGQLFKTMRDSLGKPAYFHGGRTEEVFQQQLDQVLAERMTQAQGGRYAEAMYDLQFGDSRGASFSASL